MNTLSFFCLLLLMNIALGGLFKRNVLNGTCVCRNGVNGADGRDGRYGKDGKDGSLVIVGGKPGETIKQGPPGPIGPAGKNGRPGADGVPGIQGPSGDIGQRGQPGSSGPDGIGSSMEEIGRLVEETIRKIRGGDGSTGKTDTGGTTDSTKNEPYSVCKEFSGACGTCVCKEKNFNEQFNGKDYYCDCQDILPERDCLQHRLNERYTNGVYLISPGRHGPFPVYCDMVTDGGGWVVIQRRSSGLVDFKRDWFAYEHGFGNFPDEYWLGLKSTFLVQVYDDIPGTEMWLELIDIEDKGYRIRYSAFELGDETTKYKLEVNGYSGDGGDWLKDYNNQKFSTYDDDNDVSGNNLALTYGPFWHGSTYYDTHPNNNYIFYQVSTKGYVQPQTRVFKGKINGKVAYIKSMEMKIRRKY